MDSHRFGRGLNKLWVNVATKYPKRGAKFSISIMNVQVHFFAAFVVWKLKLQEREPNHVIIWCAYVPPTVHLVRVQWIVEVLYYTRSRHDLPCANYIRKQVISSQFANSS